MKYTFAKGVSPEDARVVYVLIDPRTQDVKYVGKTYKTLKRRIEQHFSKSELKHNTRKTAWLKSLTILNLLPVVDIIEACDDAVALNIAEAFHIASFRAAGVTLLNHTDGGDGVIGYKHTKETKEKLSKIMSQPRGAHSEERVINLSRAQGGRPVIDSEGIRYETFAEAARALSISVNAVAGLAKGTMNSDRGIQLRFEDEDFPPRKINKIKSGQTIIDDKGNEYASVREACRILGVPRYDMKRHLAGHIGSIEGRILHIVEGKKAGFKAGAKVIDQYGTLYASVSEAARITGCSDGCIIKVCAGEHAQAKGYAFRYVDGVSIDINLHPAEPVKRKGSYSIIDDQGTKYPSLTEAAKAFGVSKTAILLVLKGINKTAKGRSFRYATEDEI